MDDRLSPVVFTDEMKQRVRDAAAVQSPEGQPAPERKKPLRLRRFALTAAAACLVIVFSVGALAGAFPSFDRFIDWMRGEGVDNAEALMQPVNLEDAGTGMGNSAGISMEVLAAVNDGEAAVVYLALSDGGAGLVDENTELYDIDIDGTMMQWGQMAYYDEEAAAAVFRLEGNGQPVRGQQADTSLAGGDITVTVNSILTGVQYFDKLETGLSLAGINGANPQPALEGTNALNENGWAINSFGITYGEDPTAAEALSNLFDNGELPLLASAAAAYTPTEADWLEITAAGVVDGFLHVRYRAASDAGRYGMTDFYLTWPGGAEETYSHGLTTATVYLGEGEQIGYNHLYPEYEVIMELPADVPAEDVRLVLGGSRCDARITGNWSVTFRLDERPPILEAGCHIDLGGVIVDRIIVSSIGVTAFSHGIYGPNSLPLDIEVYLKDGTRVGTDSAFSSSNMQTDTHVTRNSFAHPINIDDVDHVTANGQKLTLTPVP